MHSPELFRYLFKIFTTYSQWACKIWGNKMWSVSYKVSQTLMSSSFKIESFVLSKESIVYSVGIYTYNSKTSKRFRKRNSKSRCPKNIYSNANDWNRLFYFYTIHEAILMDQEKQINEGSSLLMSLLPWPGVPGKPFPPSPLLKPCCQQNGISSYPSTRLQVTKSKAVSTESSFLFEVKSPLKY